MSELHKNRRGRRLAAPLTLAAGLAVLMHVALLRGLDREPQEREPGATPVKAVNVKAAPPPAPAQAARPQPEPGTLAPEPTQVPKQRREKTPAATKGKALAATTVVVPPALPPSQAPAMVTAALEVQPIAAANPSESAMPDKVPVYKTRVPPSTTLRYAMGRGAISGEGELRWQHDGRSYDLRLEGRVPLLGTLLTQVSRGGFDAAGLAPERHTDKRRRRGEQAANFQRDAGLITFSGSSAQYPLVAGAQDRVSWMLQLAGIAEAWRGPLAVGEHIALLVASARGDADVWSFRVLGAETVSLPVGTVPTLKLLREPRRPYDTKVEVWLDPARHHLPVRARLTDTNGDPFELQLSQETRAP
jgi:hypothetical protein